MHQIFIFESSIDNPPCGVVGEKFTKCINLIKRGDHYNFCCFKWKTKDIKSKVSIIGCNKRYKNFHNFSYIKLSINNKFFGCFGYPVPSHHIRPRPPALIIPAQPPPRLRPFTMIMCTLLSMVYGLFKLCSFKLLSHVHVLKKIPHY